MRTKKEPETAPVPTAVRYARTLARAHAHTHSQQHRSCVTKGKASSAALVPWLPSLRGLLWYFQKQRQRWTIEKGQLGVSMDCFLAPAGRNAFPSSLARSHDFGRQEHEPRSATGTHTSAVEYGSPCVPRGRKIKSLVSRKKSPLGIRTRTRYEYMYCVTFHDHIPGTGT